MIEKTDRRQHSPAVERRPIRERTTAIVIHHLGVDLDRDGAFTVEDAIQFFVHDPEGVATVTLGGSRESNAATVARWKSEGLPAAYQGKGYVPYHFLIDAGGQVSRMLDLSAKGAHAGNTRCDWNDISVGVAFLGDFSKLPPSEAELAAGVALLEDIRAVYPTAEILSHDETLRRNSLEPKGCPGPMFALNDVRARVRRVRQ